MTPEEVKQATRRSLAPTIIIYEPKQREYTVLGVGKGKLPDGSWFEGATYQGEDGVYYTRPYDMFSDFRVK